MMELLFNRDGNGAKELRMLTGGYSAANRFENIESDVVSATRDLVTVIGNRIYAKAVRAYQEGDGNELVRLAQRPVAMLACARYFRRTDLTHEDGGRKVRQASDGTDRLPWEWQTDRDERAYLDEYYRDTERLLEWLNEQKPEEWTGSEQYARRKSLLIQNGAEFDLYYPIDGSERMFVLLSGFIREAQTAIIRPAYGTGFDLLANGAEDALEDARFAACKALALLSMAKAFRRMPLQLIPVGVVRSYTPSNGMQAAEPATLKDVQVLARTLEMDAMDWVRRMKEYRDREQGESELLPKNGRENKFIRL